MGLSQKLFTKKIFISTSQYACLESGHRKIKGTVIDSIITIFNVNREWLLIGEGEMFDSSPPDTKREELLSIFEWLNPHFQACILNEIKLFEKVQKKRNALLGLD